SADSRDGLKVGHDGTRPSGAVRSRSAGLADRRTDGAPRPAILDRVLAGSRDRRASRRDPAPSQSAPHAERSYRRRDEQRQDDAGGPIYTAPPAHARAIEGPDSDGAGAGHSGRKPFLCRNSRSAQRALPPAGNGGEAADSSSAFVTLDRPGNVADRRDPPYRRRPLRQAAALLERAEVSRQRTADSAGRDRDLGRPAGRSHGPADCQPF